jgi:3-oxoacyl-[acyl-carrier protein] reductase
VDLGGKRVIVTGGAGSLGRCMVEQLVARGAVVTVFDIDANGLAELEREHSDVSSIECDVSDHEQVAAATQEYRERFGAPDVLINNAAIIYSAPLVRMSAAGIEVHDAEMWNRVLSTGLSSVFYMSARVVEQMVAARVRGVVVNISSVVAAGNAGQSAYSAAKAGVNALTAVWARELSPLGVRVVAVAPGFTETAALDSAMSPGALRETVQRIPLRRLGKPAEVADGVMCAIENDYFNGKVLPLDGGLVP